MIRRRFLLVSAVLMAGLALTIAARGASQDVPASSWPALDQAGRAFAERNLAEAKEGFEAVAENTSMTAFARGLALFGLAEVAMARQDTAAAVAAWGRLAADPTLLRFHRETAERRIAETKRLDRGLPARDPAAYRETLPAAPKPGRVLHVAPTGDDAADGSRETPFRSLERARDAVRSLKQSASGELPKGGVKVAIGAGEYQWKRTLQLTDEDSGTAEAPVVYEGPPYGKAILRGGVRVKGWKPVSDAAVRDMLDASVRHRVLEADLTTLGVDDWGDATTLRRRPELFVDGKPQTLARWPNEGFVKTGEILGTDTFKVWDRIEGCRDGKFRYIEDRPSRWLDEPDVRLYGYWFEEYQKVAAIDADEKTFTLARPYSNYGYRQGQRYYALNVFRELDAEGEWYLDRQARIVYWLPPQGLDVSKAEVVLSVVDRPFITMTDVEHVVVRGLTLQEGRGDGIHVRGGAHGLIADCTLQRFGGDAIVVDGGRRHGVFDCTMRTLGCGGARVAGGDRRTLTPGRHFVENCIVSDISRVKRTYAPAVHLDGCGNRIAHNLFEDMPSSAMRIEGNDHLIELNWIRNVVRESDDQGGLDMWGNPLYRGVVIRWNRWSDIRGGTVHGAAGVRLDDFISGIVIYGNLFERCGAVNFGSVQIHGGKENLIEGNLFVDGPAGLTFSRWGESRWLESIERFLPQAAEPPYVSRYPELVHIKSDADVNMIGRNLFAQCESIFQRDGGIQKTALNAVANGALVQQIASGAAVRSDSGLLRAVLFEPIPVNEIGPYKLDRR